MTYTKIEDRFYGLFNIRIYSKNLVGAGACLGGSGDMICVIPISDFVLPNPPPYPPSEIFILTLPLNLHQHLCNIKFQTSKIKP